MSMGLVLGINLIFFNKISNHIGRMGNDHVIAAGDWNAILNMKLDTRNYQNLAHRPRARMRIVNMMEKYDLIDVWREYHPERRKHTWRTFNSTKQGRLDYFLVSADLMADINDENSINRIRTDELDFSR